MKMGLLWLVQTLFESMIYAANELTVILKRFLKQCGPKYFCTWTINQPASGH